MEQIVHTRRVGTPRLGGKEKNSQTIDLYCFAIFGQKAYPKGSQTGRNNWISGPVEHVARFQTESEDQLGSIDVWSSVGTGANMTLWNSINVPEVLPAAVCGLDTTVIESCGTAAANIFAGSQVQALVVGGTGGNGTAVKLRLHNHFGANLDHSGQTISKALLKLNGNDRFTEREAVYFNKVVPWQSHLNGPPDGIYAYSFAVNPEDHQPSGTCNFSRIDNAQLTLKMIDSNLACKVKVYTVNYNVLRIMSGMGGLAYSN